ncbi:T9SS type A sorting domain-containing protein [Fulvivirga ulvae]|uniref:T9SS type A sorting domain-containing protein n=1 Tax=Fulvivirga ulvae TaxID=2904245 RepID=UPI001F26DB7E|nr:T9SS type A sorting domain-containing protein [Fulvivirga ulvae]UII30121.1 T9SS type A sorting domain-containing protein [Fulvivirga ulvae]
MKKLILIFHIFITNLALAQNVILFEDFEGGLPGWVKSVTNGVTDNEWYVLGQNSDFTSGNNCLGISTGDGNNTYNNITSDHSVWIQPDWPAVVTDQNIKIQFDGHADGEITLGADYMAIYLADIDASVVATDNNLNSTNSILIGYLYNAPAWNRYTINLNSSHLTFIQNSVFGATLVFNWKNDNNFILDQPPATIDNLLITNEPIANPPLAGSYTIGLNNGESFATLTNAFDYLSNYGQSADVNFYLTDTNYSSDFETFPLVLGDGTTTPYPGMGTYKLTIKPGSGNTPVITGDNFSETNLGTLTFRGVSNITIDGSNTVGGNSRDLTITSNDNTSNYVMPVFLAGIDEVNIMENIVVENSNLETNSQDNGYGIIAGLFNANTSNSHFSSEAAFNNLTIKNNKFQSVKEAIHIDGVDRAVLGYNGNSLALNVTIIDNEMASQDINNQIKESGIHILGVDNGLVSANTIGDFDREDLHADDGIVADQNCKNLIIEKNKIFNLGFTGDATSNISAHAINVYSGLPDCNIIIRNNEIRGIAGNGASSTANAGFLNPVAIFLGLGGEVGWIQLYNQSGIKVYNNSIYMYGNEMDFTTSVSMGIAVAANTTNVDIRNNIVKNDLGGASTLGGKASALAVFIETAASQMSYIDYNAYHVAANESYTNNYIGLVGNLTDLLTDGNTQLSSWRMTTGNDKSSLFGDPGFSSQNYLMPDISNSNSWNVSGMGVHLLSVTDDLNGVERPTTVVDGGLDLGAYEFNADPSFSLPPLVTLNGPFLTGVDYTIYINEVERFTINFDIGSDLPDQISARFYGGAWPANSGVYNVANNYTDISASGPNENIYNYALSSKYDPAYLGTLDMDASNIHITNDASYTDEWKALSTIVDLPNNMFSSSKINQFGRFTKTSTENLLPVELLEFKAKNTGSSNRISWITLSEVNNDYFILEKSHNGQDWKFLTKMQGQGTSVTLNQYETLDSNPSIRTYYKLKQMDFDGTETGFDVIYVDRISNQSATVSIKVFPNPASEKLIINNTLSENIMFEIVSISGKRVKAGKLTLGRNVLNVSEWKNGMYIFKSSVGGIPERILIKH